MVVVFSRDCLSFVMLSCRIIPRSSEVVISCLEYFADSCNFDGSSEANVLANGRLAAHFSTISPCIEKSIDQKE